MAMITVAKPLCSNDPSDGLERFQHWNNLYFYMTLYNP